MVASQPGILTLKEAFAAAGWRHCLINRATNYLIELPADLETYQASLAPGKFKRIRANLNRLKKQGEVRIDCRSGLEAEGWRATIADAALIEQASWLASTEDADFNFADPAMAAFWQAYLAHPEASRAMDFWLLHVDDRPVSFTIMLNSGDRRYNIVGLYDQAFAKASPGAVIDREAYVDSIAKGARTIDLGQGDSGYKANWGAAIEEPVEDWIAFPPGAAGRILHLAVRAKFGGREP
ncbi:MAG: GNAT family N-acetyltransferase [Rhizobiales bacterium]|nr:GNAT family N-acetyltransferase [Hyphomicrobiales bacterium]